MRTRVYLLAALWLGVVAGGQARAASDKTPDSSRHDPRLDQLVSISVAYDSLQEFCARLRGLTGGDPAAGLGSPALQGATPSSSDATAAQPGGDHSPAEGDRAPGLGQSRDQPASPRLRSPGAIARSIPVDITCDPAIKEHKVVVHVHDQPLREVMRQIAILFDFTWMPGPQEHPRYQLTQSTARARWGGELRYRLATEAEACRRRLFRDIVRALSASPAELAELAKSDPDAVTLAVASPDQYGLLLPLGEQGVDEVLSGRDVVLPFAQLPAESQEQFVGLHGPADEDAVADWSQQLAGSYVRYRRDEYSAVAIAVSIITPQPEGQRTTPRQLALLAQQPNWGRLQARHEYMSESPVASETAEEFESRYGLLTQTLGIDIAQRARDVGNESIPSWARTGPEVDAKPDGRLVSVAGPTTALPFLLRDIAEALQINLVADCHWTQRRRRGFDDSVRFPRRPPYPSLRDEQQRVCIDGNPEYVLTRIGEDHQRTWKRDGEFFRVRNLLWFLDDPEEVPASAIKGWLRHTDDEEHIALDDYVRLVDNLSQRQWENLSYTSYLNPAFPEKRLYALHNISAEDHEPLKLFTLLTPQQRRLAHTEGIAVGEFPQRLQPLMEALLGQKCLNPDRTDAPVIAVPIPEVRLFAGYRAKETMQPGMEDMEPGGPYPRAFYIELWAGGVPDWNWFDRERDHPGMYDKGRIEWWSYALKDRLEKGPEATGEQPKP